MTTNLIPTKLARCAAALLCAASLLAPALAQADVKLLKKVDPEFPREAERAGVDAGLVKARMTVTATGEVEKVDIVEAKPARYFDRVVQRTLSQWKFDSGADKRTVEIDIEFKR